MAKLIHPFGELGLSTVPFIDNKYGTNSPSESITFSIKENTTVYAMINSVVTKVTDDKELGKIIILKSSDWNYSKKNNNKPLYQTYCHLNSGSVKEGEEVKSGQEIGKTGKTGILASTGTFTIFFSESDSVPKIKSINIENYSSPEGLDFNNLTVKNKDGLTETLAKNNLKQYVHKIFGQTPQLNKQTITADLSGEDIKLIAAIVAQENGWGQNNPDPITLAKSETVCRVIRNRSYKIASTLTHAAMGLLPDKPYDTMVDNFSASLAYEANIRGQKMNFLTFVTNIVGGIDYDYIEDVAVLRGSYKKEDLYGITGFMTTNRANAYPSSIVATWDNNEYACMNWNFFPSNSKNIVNDVMPTR